MRRIAIALIAASGCAGVGIIPALAETINVSDNHGGDVGQYNAHWAALAARGVDVRIVGPCQSACTILLAHIPADRICVTANAAFGFHRAEEARFTAMLWAGYSEGIRGWINARGGLTPDFKWMRAPDTYRYFRKC
jgi:hypothetical protein